MSSSIAVQTVKARRSPRCTVLYPSSRAAMHQIYLCYFRAQLAQAMRLGQPFMAPRGEDLSLKPQPCRQRRRAARKARASSRQPKIVQCRRSRRFWTDGRLRVERKSIWFGGKIIPRARQPGSRAKTSMAKRETKRSRSLKQKRRSKWLKRWRCKGPKGGRTCCSL